MLSLPDKTWIKFCWEMASNIADKGGSSHLLQPNTLWVALTSSFPLSHF